MAQAALQSATLHQGTQQESPEAGQALDDPEVISPSGDADNTGGQRPPDGEELGAFQGGGLQHPSVPDNHNSDTLPDPTIPFIAEGFVNVDTLEYQLGGIILDAMELVERLAMAEHRNAQLWEARSANRSDQRWALALQHTIMRASLARETQEPTPSSASPQAAFTREQVRRLGYRFSREPSSLQPIVNRVWTVRCPNVFV